MQIDAAGAALRPCRNPAAAVRNAQRSAYTFCNAATVQRVHAPHAARRCGRRAPAAPAAARHTPARRAPAGPIALQRGAGSSTSFQWVARVGAFVLQAQLISNGCYERLRAAAAPPRTCHHADPLRYDVRLKVVLPRAGRCPWRCSRRCGVGGGTQRGRCTPGSGRAAGAHRRCREPGALPDTSACHASQVPHDEGSGGSDRPEQSISSSRSPRTGLNGNLGSPESALRYHQWCLRGNGR